ncbi:hypothetical protein Tco_1500395 [Tanacetum coccineum]
MLRRTLGDTLRRKGCDDSFLHWSMLRRNPSGMLRPKVPWALHFGAFLIQIPYVVFDGAFGGVRYEEVVVGEGVVVTSSSLEMLTNSCLGGIMVSLIFLEGLEEEALVEFMVGLFEEDEDGKKNKKDGLLSRKA